MEPWKPWINIRIALKSFSCLQTRQKAASSQKAQRHTDRHTPKHTCASCQCVVGMHHLTWLCFLWNPRDLAVWIMYRIRSHNEAGEGKKPKGKRLQPFRLNQTKSWTWEDKDRDSTLHSHRQLAPKSPSLYDWWYDLCGVN